MDSTLVTAWLPQHAQPSPKSTPQDAHPEAHSPTESVWQREGSRTGLLPPAALELCVRWRGKSCPFGHHRRIPRGVAGTCANDSLAASHTTTLWRLLLALSDKAHETAAATFGILIIYPQHDAFFQDYLTLPEKVVNSWSASLYRACSSENLRASQKCHCLKRPCA